MLINVFSPAIGWALTAGPTAPEATSFEPIETTDIVDLKTGDFVYNIPLLEVQAQQVVILSRFLIKLEYNQIKNPPVPGSVLL